MDKPLAATLFPPINIPRAPSDTRQLASETGLPIAPLTLIGQEYLRYQTQWEAQDSSLQTLIARQAAQMAGALSRAERQVQFSLPERVRIIDLDGLPRELPVHAHRQSAGGLLPHLMHTALKESLRKRFAQLIADRDPAVKVATELLLYATVLALVTDHIPVGNPVLYIAAAEDEIPNLPAASISDSCPGFYLPELAAFDEHGLMQVDSVATAREQVARLQQYTELLQAAVDLAPYIAADKVYQQKRYGILGQFVFQARALAWRQTGDIIRVVKERSAAGDLNRGLSLSLPYFDDQELTIKNCDFMVIPYGRMSFAPALVIGAAQDQIIQVIRESSLSPATRIHLIRQLRRIEGAFRSNPTD